MNTEEQSSMSDQPSKTPASLDQETLLALASVRPPTPDKCAVCLNNKQPDVIARIDSCAHTFCFPCVLEWSKVRAICPLCKQPFTIITRERYSGELIEEVRVQAPQRSASSTFNNLNDVLNWVDRHHTRTENPGTHQRNDIFRQMVYIEWLNTIQSITHRPNRLTRDSTRTTTAGHHDVSSWANLISLDSIRRLLHRYLRQTTSDLRESTVYSQSTRQTVAFRKHIYLNRLHVHSPLTGHNNDTLTVRECSPTWYASNPACLHRLVPFLARELLALLWNDEATIERTIQEILTAVQLHDIRSRYLIRKLNDSLGRYTKHFLHEFYTFARCPYDLAGFDRHARYSSAHSTPPAAQPMQISIDDDHGDNEQTPIVLDETADISIDITDSTSSASSSPSTIESDERSTSPECEIVEYVEPTGERTPTLIVLSEDEDDANNPRDLPSQAAASTKRKHCCSHERSKKQQTTSVSNLNIPTSVTLDDDDDDDDADDHDDDDDDRPQINPPTDEQIPQESDDR